MLNTSRKRPSSCTQNVISRAEHVQLMTSDLQTSSSAVHVSRMKELYHDCSICSKSLEALTSHVCRVHRRDPRFLVSCKSCFRSYRKWDSYRKHLQRGCQMIPSQSTSGVSTFCMETVNRSHFIW